MENKRLKVAYFLESLVAFGGVERVLTDKANYMAIYFDYDVYIITCAQNPKQQNAFLLHESVEQVNLDVPYYEQYHYGYPKRLLVKRRIEKLIRQRLSEAIKIIDPDILIGVTHFEANLVSTIPCRAKKVIESHEARPFTMSGMSQYRNILSSIYMKFYRQVYLRTIERRADVVVSLTEGDAHEWRKSRRVEVIPNFSLMPIAEYCNCDTKRVIAAGRLSWEKGYDRLLKVWQIVSQRFPDWQLDIFGNGNLQESLEETIKNMEFQNVTIHPPVKDIDHEYANSSVCVLTSYFEGFALVLLESLRHGLPCVAFDCKFGPRSIIDDGACGYLVEDGNIELFAERVCNLIEFENKRMQFSLMAVEHARKFDVYGTMTKWKTLFENLVQQ